MKACDLPYASHCAPAISEILFEARRYEQWLDQSIGPMGNNETRELKAYFAKEQKAFTRQLNDAISRGNNEARWLNAFSRENKDMWRFMGLGSQNGLSNLDIPQQLKGQYTFNFSQGVSQ